jgi:putative hydrolase of the HAD superfamily
MTPPIKLVVFDLGRVLIRICNDWSEACNRAGVTWAAEMQARMAMPVMVELAHLHDTGALDTRRFADAASPIVLMPAEDIIAAWKRYLHTAYPGVGELIDELNSRGVATACLSNTNESHWRIMSNPAETSHVPLHRLTHRFASHLAGLRKPDPAIYAYIERETKIAPASILFFDDVAENIEAAQKRGWHGWRVDPTFDNPIPHIRKELARYHLVD